MPLPALRRIILLWPVLLAACASVDRAAAPPAPAPELPARWAATDTDRPAADAALATWWQQLGSAEFNTLAERALARNTSLRSAQAALRQGEIERCMDDAVAGVVQVMDEMEHPQRPAHAAILAALAR